MGKHQRGVHGVEAIIPMAAAHATWMMPSTISRMRRCGSRPWPGGMRCASRTCSSPWRMPQAGWRWPGPLICCMEGGSRSPAFVLHPAGGRAGAACAVRPCAHGQHHHAACGGQASAGPDALYACCAAAHEPITVPGVTARQATGPSGYGKPESGVWGNGLLKGMRLRRQGCGAAWLTPPPAPAAAPHHENSPASPAFPAIPGLLHPCVHPVLLPWRALSLPPGWNQDD